MIPVHLSGSVFYNRDMSENFTFKLKQLGPLPSHAAYRKVLEAILSDPQPVLYWDGKKMTTDHTPKGRLRSHEASLSLVCGTEDKAAPELVWSDPYHTLRFALPAGLHAEDTAFAFIVFLASALDQGDLLDLRGRAKQPVLCFKNKPVFSFSNLSVSTLASPDEHYCEMFSQQKEALQLSLDAFDQLCEMRTNYISRKNLHPLDLQDSLQIYNDLLEDSEFRSVEQTFLDQQKNASSQDFSFDSHESIDLESNRAILELLLFLAGHILEGEDDFSDLFNAHLAGDTGKISEILDSEDPLDDQILSNPLKIMEWGYIEWMSNEIIHGLHPDYAQSFADALSTSEFPYDRTRLDIEEMRVKTLTKLLRFYIRYNLPLPPESMAYLMHPLIMDYPEEVVFSTQNLVFVYATLMTFGGDEFDGERLDDMLEENDMSEVLSSLNEKLVSLLQAESDLSIYDPSILLAALCGLFKTASDRLKGEIISVCEKALAAIQPALKPVNEPSEALISAFINLTLMIGYEILLNESETESDSLISMQSSILFALADSHRLLSVMGFAAVCLFSQSLMTTPAQAKSSLSRIFDMLLHRPSLMDPLLFSTVPTLLLFAEDRLRLSENDPYFLYYLILRESFYVLSPFSLSFSFEEILSSAREAAGYESPRVASELFDQLILFIDDFNMQRYRHLHEGNMEDFDPGRGLASQRVRLLSYAAANMFNLSTQAAPRLMLNLLSVLQKWEPSDSTDAITQIEGYSSLSRLFSLAGADEAAGMMLYLSGHGLADYLKNYGEDENQNDFTKAGLENGQLTLHNAFVRSDRTLIARAYPPVLSLTYELIEDAEERQDDFDVYAIINDPAWIEAIKAKISEENGQDILDTYLSLISTLYKIDDPDDLSAASAGAVRQTFQFTVDRLIEQNDLDSLHRICTTQILYAAPCGIDLLIDTSLQAMLLQLQALYTENDMESLKEIASVFTTRMSEEGLPETGNPLGWPYMKLSLSGLMAQRSIYAFEGKQSKQSTDDFTSLTLFVLADTVRDLSVLRRLLGLSITEEFSVWLSRFIKSDPDWIRLQKDFLVTDELQTVGEDMLELSALLKQNMDPLLEIRFQPTSVPRDQILDLVELVEQKARIRLPRMKMVLRISEAIQKSVDSCLTNGTDILADLSSCLKTFKGELARLNDREFADWTTGLIQLLPVLIHLDFESALGSDTKKRKSNPAAPSNEAEAMLCKPVLFASLVLLIVRADVMTRSELKDHFKQICRLFDQCAAYLTDLDLHILYGMLLEIELLLRDSEGPFIRSIETWTGPLARRIEKKALTLHIQKSRD